MIFKQIEGFPYVVSIYGDVISQPRYRVVRGGGLQFIPRRQIKQNIGSSGYYKLCLCVNSKIKCFRVHRLVAKAFIPNPENKSHINHKNGNKLDNRADNLEWCTPSENMKHAYSIGSRTPTPPKLRGVMHPHSKLTAEDIINIRRLSTNGETYASIANYYQVSRGSIFNIIKGRTWTHIK